MQWETKSKGKHEKEIEGEKRLKFRKTTRQGEGYRFMRIGERVMMRGEQKADTVHEKERWKTNESNTLFNDGEVKALEGRSIHCMRVCPQVTKDTPNMQAENI